MYLYGVLFSCMNMYAEGVAVQHWARGYNFWAVMSVLCLSLTGLATSAVMKYADNLIKVFALAGSMIFTTVASALLFGTVITLLFMLGTLVACLSCYLYFAEDSRMFDVLDNCGGVCNMAMAGDAPVVTYSGPKDARVMSDSLKEPLNMKRDKEEP
mmetsp:Transcript_31076/g.67900  ORF Transcript_31076/g.67900 Transcript_31076/m.67900 type:complete len:156 (-) Transcript_31076:411-878(-)